MDRNTQPLALLLPLAIPAVWKILRSSFPSSSSSSSSSPSSPCPSPSLSPSLFDFPRTEFLSLLRTLLSFTATLQNASGRLIPRETQVANAICEYLKDVTSPRGPLEVRKFEYVEGRSNLIVHFKSESKESNQISFVGMHFDVVPAIVSEWSNGRNPFQLTVDSDGETIWGRGVTDCLGHCAMFAVIMKHLALRKSKLNKNISCVFIANEENSTDPGIGIDELHRRGELEFLKKGPVFWVDSANSQPTIGTGGIQTWKLTATGKGFHSGFPHKAINALSLASESIRYIQHRFYEDFPHEINDSTKDYNFLVGSSLKPTGITTPPSGVTIIPRECTITGDIRLTPFYKFEEVRSKINGYVRTLNEDLIPNGKLQNFGAESFVLKDTQSESAVKGHIEFEFLGFPSKGVAVNLRTLGFAAISSACRKVYGKVEPFSLTGSLPIISDLSDSGLDVQIIGFGRMEAYHAANEFAKVSEFEKGALVANEIIQFCETH